jgi:hypothetical protein
MNEHFLGVDGGFELRPTAGQLTNNCAAVRPAGLKSGLSWYIGQ